MKNFFGVILLVIGVKLIEISLDLITDKEIQKKILKAAQEAVNTVMQ